MDVETPVETGNKRQEQLPQIRRIAKLDDIRRVIPAKPIIPLEKRIIHPKQSINYSLFILIGIFLAVFAFELAVIYRFDKLNKRYYRIALSHKNTAIDLKSRLEHADRLKNALADNRQLLVKVHLMLASKYKILQFNIDKNKSDYENMLSQNKNTISLLEGDLRVASAKAEAVVVQNELLTQEINRKNEYLKELTDRLLYNIEQQKILVNENLKLKEVPALSNKESVQIGVFKDNKPMEEKNVN